MWDWNFAWGWGGMAFMIIGVVIFWAAIIVLIVWGVTRATRSSHPGSVSRGEPLDIAKERYARGEITKEQFEQIKKDLS